MEVVNSTHSGPRETKDGQAHTAQARGRKRAGRQTGRHVWRPDRAAAPSPSQFLRHCPFWHLPSALRGNKAGPGEGRSTLKSKPPPFLSLVISCTTYLLWFALNRLGSGEEEKAVMAVGQTRDCLHPFILLAPYLLSPRLRRSPQARILFWASMCVRLPAFSPSMLSTQSPTATPACAALPPGVSCGEEWSEAHGPTPKLCHLPFHCLVVYSSL